MLEDYRVNKLKEAGLLKHTPLAGSLLLMREDMTQIVLLDDDRLVGESRGLHNPF